MEGQRGRMYGHGKKRIYDHGKKETHGERRLHRGVKRSVMAEGGSVEKRELQRGGSDPRGERLPGGWPCVPRGPHATRWHLNHLERVEGTAAGGAGTRGPGHAGAARGALGSGSFENCSLQAVPGGNSALWAG